MRERNASCIREGAPETVVTDGIYGRADCKKFGLDGGWGHGVRRRGLEKYVDVDVDGFRVFKRLGAMTKKYGYDMDSVCVELGADEIGMRKEG